MAIKSRKKIYSEYEKVEKFKKAEEEAREDVKLFVGGIIFTFSFLWAMLEWGEAAGWYAPSPTVYNQPGQENSRERFEQGPLECEMDYDLCNTTEIGYYGPGCVTRWYYWKLRPELAWSYVIPWAFYLMHQITVWAGVFYAQKLKDSEFGRDIGVEAKFTTKLSSFNYFLTAANVFFVIAHLVITHISYDGLAPTVAESTSQASVILMGCIILVLGTFDRGFLFGWPDLRENEPSFARWFISRYHGYVIFWGICYTFWYHPMESTPGHFLGFTNGCLCFLQSSMIYTKMHVTKQWTFFIELWPLIHSCVIAYQTGNRDLPQREDLWPIFFFGFTTVLVIAWIFTFDFWWRENSTLVRFFPFVIWLAYCSNWFLPDRVQDLWQLIAIPSTYLIFGPFFYIVCHISGLILEMLPFSIQKPKGPVQEKLFLALFIVMYIINYYFCWALEFGEIRCEKIWAQMIFLQALVSLIPFTLLTVGSMVMVHLAHLANDDEMNTSDKIESKKNISEDDQPLLSEHHVSEVVSE